MAADHNDAPARAELLDALLSAHAAGAARFLIRGATIVSMDRSIGDLARGDILVVDDVIEAIGPDLSEAASDGQAIVVDASDQIAIPGMVDGHRHSWQTQFRRLTPDFDLEDYTELMHVRLAPNYRPHDMYVGNLLAAAAAIDGGITSVLDFSHNSRSPDHCDEAIRAWKESGLRVAFGCCAPFVPEPGYGWRDDLKRMRSDHFASEDGLVSLRLAAVLQAFPAIQGDIRFSDDSARFARELGIGISIDAALGTRAADHIVALERAGSLGPDVTLIHCVALHAEAWRAIVSSGTRVVLAVTSDANLRQFDGTSPVQTVLDHGIRPGLSIDVECSLTTDMFTQMQVAMSNQRMQSAQRMHAGEDAPEPISTQAVLEWATIGGAEANGFANRCGSLSPGKQADIVLIDANEVNNLPLNNAVATVVLGADGRNVNAVFVAGVPRKWNGRLLEPELKHLRRLAQESRDWLLESVGMELDIVARASATSPPPQWNEQQLD